MRLGKGEHNPLGADSVGPQLGEISRKYVHEPHVQLLLAQLGARSDRAARKEIQSNVRPSVAEVAQDRGKLAAVCSAIGESDAQASDLALSYEPGSLYAPFKIGEESPSFFKEGPAGFCQAHAPLQSLKEPVSNLFFKLLYLPRQSRLSHAQSLGRPPKMLFFPNSDEVTKVSQFHKISNSRRRYTQTYTSGRFPSPDVGREADRLLTCSRQTPEHLQDRYPVRYWSLKQG